ncbi:MAG: M23 family metallopeptidase [Anaerolineales bacterium]|nr:M23 family metallopeptidase [Anaerolineales bacterium]MCS7247638.1 M23 family metallopeptidase [Anaerolineales bacterium]MDW8161448.1 M23 family metallopeptidase [Anaerolineales bacterium]MDW8445954.1 M23 family metallopeptidase [Anaerolineales bacterium]
MEFVNRAGEPVYAAADGWVEFAGEDDQVSLATKRGFYGKVVILKHWFSEYAYPVYTLYGHLLKVEVENEQTVNLGQKIGEVGLGGVAAGTHLHFEIRVGQNEYGATRNPELWFPPALPESGILAGRFLDLQGNCLEIPNLVLEPLDLPDAIHKRRYFATYEDPRLSCLTPWGENFGMNDLPAGRYRLSYIYTKPEEVEFEISAGKVTYLNIRLP